MKIFGDESGFSLLAAIGILAAVGLVLVYYNDLVSKSQLDFKIERVQSDTAVARGFLSLDHLDCPMTKAAIDAAGVNCSSSTPQVIKLYDSNGIPVPLSYDAKGQIKFDHLTVRAVCFNNIVTYQYAAFDAKGSMIRDHSQRLTGNWQDLFAGRYSLYTPVKEFPCPDPDADYDWASYAARAGKVIPEDLLKAPPE
jgi:hypothetical protein